MAKSEAKPKGPLKPKDPEPIETGYMIRKISLSEYQIIGLKIQGNEVIEKTLFEPDLPVIILKKLREKIANQEV